MTMVSRQHQQFHVSSIPSGKWYFSYSPNCGLWYTYDVSVLTDLTMAWNQNPLN